MCCFCPGQPFSGRDRAGLIFLRGQVEIQTPLRPINRKTGERVSKETVKFSRTKLVSVYREKPDLLIAHGILEDDIYGLEVDVTLALPDLVIKAIQGQWKRAENSQCIRGLPFLQEAVGLRLEEGFIAKVQKGIGRKVCRHFADLLIESCSAAMEAAVMIQGEKDNRDNPVMDPVPGTSPGPSRWTVSPEMPLDPIKNGKITASPNQKIQRTGGMVIDLHVHSFPASPCSSVSLKELIEEARKIGLDGFCLTDHHHVWNPREVAHLRETTDFLILRGNEITTEQGDMLVFGLDRDILEIVSLADLRAEVSNVNGFIIAAHPFRGFLAFGVGKLGLTLEQAIERPLWKSVDAVEVMNSRVTGKENAFAAQVAARLNRPATGGSDAHTLSGLGIFATRFSQDIQDEQDLIEALKSGHYQPVAFRSEQRKRDFSDGKNR